MMTQSPRQTFTHPFFRLDTLLIRINWATVAAFGLPMLLYWLTLAPTVYNLDSAEFSTAVATGGIVRATGYPLYLTIGKLWSLLPIGDIGYRMNLFSAVCGSCTILQVELIMRRLQVSRWARLGALGLLATAPYFWSMSLMAEVYTLHTALMTAVMLSLLWWRDNPTPTQLALPVMLMALSMGNHAATSLLVPACIWFVLSVAPRTVLQPRTIIAVIIALLAGLSIFLYIPIRYAANPIFNYAGHFTADGIFQPINLQQGENLWWLVTGKSFAGQMFGYQWNEMGAQFASYGDQLWQAFMGIGIAPALVGAYLLLKRDWRMGVFLLLIFVANALFYINYRVVDKNTMFLPTYVVWSIWLAIGYQWVLQQAAALKKPQRTKSGGQFVKIFCQENLARLVIVGVVLFALAWNWQRVDLSADTSARDQAETILAQVEPNAIVLGWWEIIPAVEYLQYVEGARPDVLAINRFLISGNDLQTLLQNELGKRPIYINEPPRHLSHLLTSTRVGQLFRLDPIEPCTHCNLPNWRK